MALCATAAVGRSASCRSICFATALAEPLGSGQQNGRRIHIVLSLRQHVGREMPRVAFGGDDQDLSRAGHEVDAHFAGQQFLGGGDIDVARSDDAVGARHVRVP